MRFTFKTVRFTAALGLACISQLGMADSAAAGADAGLEPASACLPMSEATRAALQEMRRSLLTPGAQVDLAQLGKSAIFLESRRDEEQRRATDWANLCRYKSSNMALAASPHPTVVFIGDSITENWAEAAPEFIDGHQIVGRGIGGQSSAQILLRFYADVISLHPRVVHIMAGTNDVAGNTGPASDVDIKNNLRAMTELAQANNIKVILASIPPARAFPWSPGLAPARRIARLNDFIRAYAAERGALYADYYPALHDGAGGMRLKLSNDGVHPNSGGYAIMRPIAAAAISRMLAKANIGRTASPKPGG